MLKQWISLRKGKDTRAFTESLQDSVLYSLIAIVTGTAFIIFLWYIDTHRHVHEHMDALLALGALLCIYGIFRAIILWQDMLTLTRLTSPQAMESSANMLRRRAWEVEKRHKEKNKLLLESAFLFLCIVAIMLNLPFFLEEFRKMTAEHKASMNLILFGFVIIWALAAILESSKYPVQLIRAVIQDARTAGKPEEKEEH